MTPIDASGRGVTMVTRPRVPDETRALVAATMAADVTFRTCAPLSAVLSGLAGAHARHGARATAAVGSWRAGASLLLDHLLRAVPVGADVGLPLGVGFAHAGAELVLVLAAADDSWRVGVVAEQLGDRRADVAFEIEPVAPPGVALDEPHRPSDARLSLRLLRGGR